MTPTPTSLRLRFFAALGALPLAACGEPPYDSTACLIVADDATTCPSEAEASAQLVGPGCGSRIVSVDGEGELQTGGDTGYAGAECCYPVTRKNLNDGCVVGRPYYAEGVLVTAEAIPGRGWAGPGRPRVSRMDPEHRRVLADAWTRDALIEHASVAAFSRFALELMSVGAPADLVDRAHAAARDEVRHARLAFALAEGYRGGPVAPGRFPFGGQMELGNDLAEIAVATVREGAIGETVVALLAVEALRTTKDPAVRRVLQVVASDESRHAELAWSALRWMVATGGDRVRYAVAGVFGEVAQEGIAPPEVTFGAPDELLAAHGRIRQAATDAMVARAIDEVILPCGRALRAA